jgi:CheY-like chemotaxis protein
MQRIFEPFYTTKATGRGLGTSAIFGAVKSHNGALTLNSILGYGTTFRIFLSSETTTHRGEGALHGNQSESWKGSGTILLVDDEDAILLSTSYILKKLGFTVIEAKNGKEALECSRQFFSDIVLVLTDIGMPEMNGQELICELRKLKPQLPIILSSGYADSNLRSQIDEDGLAGFLNKPYSFEELQVVLKDALDKAERT